MSHRKARLLRLLGVAAVVVAAVVTALVGGAGYRPHAEAVARPLLTQPRSAHAATQPRPTSQCLTVYGIHCYSPAQLENAYDLAPLQARGVAGAGQTIAIVDSFGSPTIVQDLHQFDQTFGVSNPWGIPVDPAIANDPKLTIIQPAGPVPAFDPTNDDMVGWAEETTLDVEWAHVFAPKANILLVETPVSETEGVTGFPEMMQAENYVIDHHLAGVISQSFGATENTFPNVQSLLQLRYAFENAAQKGITVLGASGDTGSTDFELNLEDLYPYQVNSWPSSDPLVTSVGGTQLTLDDAGNRLAPDVVWNDGYGAGGGGPSHVFSSAGLPGSRPARGRPGARHARHQHERGRRRRCLGLLHVREPVLAVPHLRRDERGDARVRGHRRDGRPVRGAAARVAQRRALLARQSEERRLAGPARRCRRRDAR